MAEGEETSSAPKIKSSKSRKIFQVDSLATTSPSAGIVAEHEVEDPETKKRFTLYTHEINKQACDAIVACPDIDSSYDPGGSCTSLFSQKLW